MKTNLLLLDNKMKKEWAEQNNVDTNTTENDEKAGMEALMFQGMKNVMANPKLAERLGALNDDTLVAENAEDAENTNNNAETISFKQNAIQKFVLGTAATLALGGLSSCVENNSTTNQSIEYAEYKTDTSNLESLVSGIQNTLLQFYALGQLSQEKYDQSMEDTERWRAQISGDISAIKSVLGILADAIFVVNENTAAIYNQNNAFQKGIVDMMTQSLQNQSDAIALFNKTYAEVVSGNKANIEALAELIQLTQEGNAHLASMDEKMDNAGALLKTTTDALLRMEENGKSTAADIQVIKNNTTQIAQTQLEQTDIYINQLKKMDRHNQDAVMWLAQQNDCNVQKVLNRLDQLGIKVDYNTQATFWTKDRLAGALAMATKAINNQTNAINGFRGDFDEFAGYALGFYRDTDKKVGACFSVLANHAFNVDNAFNKLQGSVNFANMSNSHMAQNTDIIKQEGANIEGIAKLLSGYVKDIKGNVTTITDFSNRCGVTPDELRQAACYLGYSISEVQTWRPDKFISVFQNCFNKQNELIGANGKKLDKLSIISNSILIEAREYFQNSINAHGNIIQLNWYQKAAIIDSNIKLSQIIEQNKLREPQISALNSGISPLITLVGHLKTCGYDNMNCAQFKQILKERHPEDYQFYNKLISDFNFGGNVDNANAEDLLEEIKTIKGSEAEIWNKILELMEKYPQYQNEIRQVMKNQYIFDCCSKKDCENNRNFYENLSNKCQNKLW